MTIIIRPGGREDFPTYKSIPMLKVIRSKYVLREIDHGLGGIVFDEEPVQEYVVDMGSEEYPLRWDEDFDLTNWGFAIAWDGDRAVGGVALAYDTPGVKMLAGRKDLTVLWDIRVNPSYQGRGLGQRLFQYAVDWAEAHNCTQLKIETQQDNVTACKFYARQGCHLGEINRYAYWGEDTGEIMLIWYKDLCLL